MPSTTSAPRLVIEATPNEVLRNVIEHPTFGLRVHDMRPTHSGVAALLTPSVEDMGKVKKNPKFLEVGLPLRIAESSLYFAQA